MVPDRRQNVHLTTATGQTDKQHNIFDIKLCSEANDILLNAIQIDSLPLPQVNGQLKQLLNSYGFDSLPSNREIKSSIYVLLGASHLSLHPSSGNSKLIPRSLHEKYPALRIFISKIDGQKILAGCLGNGGTLHNNIHTSHTDTQITFAGEASLDDDDEEEENDHDALTIGETELDLDEIFFAGKLSQEGALDDEIYWSDTSSDCSGIDLDDPNDIYWSSDDDEDDNDHEDDNDEDGSWEKFQEDSGAGQRWHTQSPTHQISPHDDDEIDSDDESDGDNDGDGGDEEGWRGSQEGRSGQQWEQHHTTPHTQYFF